MPKKKINPVITEESVPAVVAIAEEPTLEGSAEVLTEEVLELSAQDTYAAILAQSAPIENRFVEGRAKRADALVADNSAIQEQVRMMNHRDQNRMASVLGTAARTNRKQEPAEPTVVHVAKGQTRPGVKNEEITEEVQ
jgi:hypothetical protein